MASFRKTGGIFARAEKLKDEIALGRNPGPARASWWPRPSGFPLGEPRPPIDATRMPRKPGAPAQGTCEGIERSFFAWFFAMLWLNMAILSEHCACPEAP